SEDDSSGKRVIYLYVLDSCGNLYLFSNRKEKNRLTALLSNVIGMHCDHYLYTAHQEPGDDSFEVVKWLNGKIDHRQYKRCVPTKVVFQQDLMGEPPHIAVQLKSRAWKVFFDEKSVSIRLPRKSEVIALFGTDFIPPGKDNSAIIEKYKSQGSKIPPLVAIGQNGQDIIIVQGTNVYKIFSAKEKILQATICKDGALVYLTGRGEYRMLNGKLLETKRAGGETSQ
ncbi:MAG: hypothetical protein GY765_10165, partial [bacterium]|nr:hypothetical protein [bacterium]